MARKPDEPYDTRLLRGRELGKDASLPHLDKRLGLLHGIEHGTRDDVTGGNPKAFTGRTSDRRRITGQHAHLDRQVGK